jgi:hypothetical protein
MGLLLAANQQLKFFAAYEIKNCPVSWANCTKNVFKLREVMSRLSNLYLPRWVLNWKKLEEKMFFLEKCLHDLSQKLHAEPCHPS